VGKPGLRARVFQTIARALAARWRWRVWLFGDAIQPASILTRYPAGRAAYGAMPPAECPLPELQEARQLPQAAAVGGR